MKLIAEKREIFGKKLTSLRDKGNIPAVVYGPKTESTSISVSMNDFKKIWEQAGESTVVNLELGGKSNNVLIHDVVLDPLNSTPLHIDFYAADMDKPVMANIHLEFEGVSPAVKQMSGVLVKVIHELEVEALPKDLPHNLIVDISKIIELGENVTVGDIKLPVGVRVIASLDDVVVVVEAQKEEKEDEEAKTIADIEVEKKGKKEEEAPTPEDNK